MIRALYTGASGMIAQQMNVETVANNLANVNTNGFKKTRVGFQDLFYAQVQQPQGAGATGLAIGQGVRLSHTNRIFTGGGMQTTGSPYDVAIEGGGFFRVQQPDGRVVYTRDGSFRVNGQGQLTTAFGGLVLGERGPITIPAEAKNPEIAVDGTVTYTDAKEQKVTAGQLSLAVFANPAGLVDLGENLWAASGASGQAQAVKPGERGAGLVSQGTLEASNVEAAEEMVTLMQAQRAYQLNSRLIQSADEMMSMANNLRR